MAIAQSEPVRDPYEPESVDSPVNPSTPTVRAPDFPPLPSIAAPRADAPAIERLKWEVQFAEGGYELSPSASSKSTLVSGLERLSGALCMPNLFIDLQDTRRLGDRDCLDYLDRLLRLDPGNPVGTCLRDGIYSQSCRRASTLQIVEPFKPRAGSSTASTAGSTDKSNDEMILAFQLDSSATSELRKKLQERLSQAIRELDSLSSSTKPAPLPTEDPMPRAKANIVRAHNTLLAASCKVSRIRFEPASIHVDKDNLLATLGERRPAGGAKPSDPLLQAMATFFPAEARPSPKPTILIQRPAPVKGQRRVRGSGAARIQSVPPSLSPAPTPVEEYIRVRYISQECANAISQVGKRDKASAGATCHLYGAYSTQCAITTKAERARMQNLSGGALPPAPQTGMIEEF